MFVTEEKKLQQANEIIRKMSDKQSNSSEKVILFHSKDKLLAKKKTPPKVE
jgi:hypothetical protein